MKRVEFNCALLVEARRARGWTLREAAGRIAEALGRQGMVEDPTKQYIRYEDGTINSVYGGVNIDDKRVLERLHAISQVFGLPLEKLTGTQRAAFSGPEEALGMFDRLEQWDALKGSVARPEPRWVTFVLSAPREQLLHLFLRRIHANLGPVAARARAEAPTFVWLEPTRVGGYWDTGAHWRDRLLDKLAPSSSAALPGARLLELSRRLPLFVILAGQLGLQLKEREWTGLQAFLEHTWPELAAQVGDGKPVRLLVALLDAHASGASDGLMFSERWTRLLSAARRGHQTLPGAALVPLKPLDWPTGAELLHWLEDDRLYTDSAGQLGVFPVTRPSEKRLRRLIPSYEAQLKQRSFTDLFHIYHWLMDELDSEMGEA